MLYWTIISILLCNRNLAASCKDQIFVSSLPPAIGSRISISFVVTSSPRRPIVLFRRSMCKKSSSSSRPNVLLPDSSFLNNFLSASDSAHFYLFLSFSSPTHTHGGRLKTVSNCTLLDICCAHDVATRHLESLCLLEPKLVLCFGKKSSHTHTDLRRHSFRISCHGPLA